MTYLAFIRREYRFLLFGFLMLGFSNYGQTFFIALYSAEIRADFNLSNAGFGAIYAAMTLLSAVVMVFSGRLIDEWPLRRFVTFVLLGMAVGCAAMGFASHIVGLCVALFVLRHFGQGLSSHTGLTAAGRAYDKNRGKAVSLVQMGFAGFESFFPLLAVGLIAAVGWQQSWFVYAVGLVVVALPVQLFLSGAEPQKKSPDTQIEADTGSVPDADRRAVLRDKRFYMVMPLNLSSPFILTGMFFHQVQLAETRGWDVAILASTFSLYAGMKVVSALVAGPLVDRYSAKRLVPFLPIPLMLALALISLPFNLFGALTPFVYMALIGIHLGSAGPVNGGLWPELFGTKHLGAIRSMVSPIIVAATAAATILFGALLDASVSFPTLAMSGIIYIAFATTLAFLGLRDKL